MERQFEHQFEWDPAKALRNAREHRVSFERAATVFLDPKAMSIFDEEHSENEEALDYTGIGSHRSAIGCLPYVPRGEEIRPWGERKDTFDFRPSGGP